MNHIDGSNIGDDIVVQILFRNTDDSVIRQCCSDFARSVGWIGSFNFVDVPSTFFDLLKIHSHVEANWPRYTHTNEIKICFPRSAFQTLHLSLTFTRIPHGTPNFVFSRLFSPTFHSKIGQSERDRWQGRLA